MAFQFKNLKIGLALSGGGVRAVAFHAGVLKWAAEKKCMDQISHISSVSGGSLFIGLVFKFCGYEWPNSTQYLETVYPKIFKLITSKSLQKNAIIKLIFNPFCWRFILSRAQVIAGCIESSWGIKATLEQIPTHPVWTINGTTAENGKRFRFKSSKMGDYRVGYADAKNFKLSKAMAVSAAFPGGIGPIILETKRYKWHKRPYWQAPKEDIILPEYEKLHLYDGGVYDNLGIETLFDIGQQKIKDEKEDVNFIMVSDAGALPKENSIPGPLSFKRLKRVADIAFDQCRALRIRCYVNFLKQNPDKGMYIQIGFNPSEHFKEKKDIWKGFKWKDLKTIIAASQYTTTLNRMEIKDFETIARHGYETALANEIVYLEGVK